MIYLNEYLDLRHIYPDMYQAISVKDFIDNRNQICIPSKWKMLSLLASWAGPQAIVEFTNVNLDFTRQKEGICRLYDLTGEINTGLMIPRFTAHTSDSLANLANGRFFEVDIIYSPEHKTSRLSRIKKFGPPRPDTEEAKETLYSRRVRTATI